MDSSAPLRDHDPKDLGLVCSVKMKREIRFRIFSWIFLKKRTLRFGIRNNLFNICLYIAYREWIKQQTNEKDQALANQKYADHLYDLKAREMDQRACELASAEADCRRAINMATKDVNLALTRERQAKEDAEKQQEQDDNFTEISNSVFGDMLTENPDVAQSAFGPHRVITDRWKGMSPAQLAEIRRIQKAQMDEKEVRTTICSLLYLVNLLHGSE